MVADLCRCEVCLTNAGDNASAIKILWQYKMMMMMLLSLVTLIMKVMIVIMYRHVVIISGINSTSPSP